MCCVPGREIVVLECGVPDVVRSPIHVNSMEQSRMATHHSNAKANAFHPATWSICLVAFRKLSTGVKDLSSYTPDTSLVDLASLVELSKALLRRTKGGLPTKRRKTEFQLSPS